jgi:hypothetical protein
MRAPALIRLTALLLWPLAAQANDVDLPELGVRLTTLPGAATRPQTTAQASGYEASLQLGPATLDIYRDEEPVAAGSDVADPSYRARLDARYPGGLASKNLGAPTAVDGHSAWTVVDAREGTAASVTRYTCVTYVINDQHLYRLSVTADGSPGRPPEFDALVRALSGLTFEPVRRASRS